MSKIELEFIKPIKFKPTKQNINIANPNSNFRINRLLFLSVSLLAILMFFLSVRFVQIKTNTIAPNIHVESLLSMKLGKYFLLLPGPHRVKISEEGYYNLENNVTVSEDKYQVQTLNLTKLPGKIELILEPVNEVEVSIDGEKYGKATNFILNVPAGRRTIEFSAKRYLSKILDVDVFGKGQSQKLFVKLEPGWADIKIDSNPSNALISVDAEPVGNTPFKFEIMQGDRIIKLNKTDYKTWSKKIQVKAGVPITLKNVVMKKKDGLAKIVTQPINAKILINGKYIGNSPIDIPLTPDKQHTLQLKEEGFKTVTQKISVPSGETKKLEFKLKEEKARLTFETRPKNAQLFIDRKYVGAATQSVQLPTRPHLITIQAAGYATYETKITPRPGFEKIIQIRLKTVEEALEEKGDMINKKSKKLMADKMRLFNPQEVILGSNRNDLNRQQNELIRKISIKRPFYISESEITNLEYKNFLAMHSSGSFNKYTLDDNDQPVVNVRWSDAVKFCNWLSRQDGIEPFYIIKYGNVVGVKPSSTGYRLPTEAEWEAVAKTEQTRFAWGKNYPPPNAFANFSDKEINSETIGKNSAYADGFEVSAPIKSFNPNANQLFDLYGNVSEWVHDFYSEKFDENSYSSDLGPISGKNHVIKGGSWMNSSKASLGVPYRNSGILGKNDLGFRVARYAQ